MRAVGRYELWTRIAAGGMGAVHLGCVKGEAGFRRAVAIKTMHESIACNPDAVASFIDEAHLAARLRHPNLVSTLDVVHSDGVLILAMEYVHGESLSRLCPASPATNPIPNPVPGRIAVAIIAGALHGLHAAHEAKADDGSLLGLVHRDVSPQNILVGVDGVARVADFGVAKAAGRIHQTDEGSLKGKVAYMAPEQIQAQSLDRRTDIFAIGVVLWEILTGTRLFASTNEGATIQNILQLAVPRPSSKMALPMSGLDDIVLRALDRDANKRFPTAREMARALEKSGHAASASDVGDWVTERASDSLAKRAETVDAIERAGGRSLESLERLAASIASSSRDARPNDGHTRTLRTMTTPGGAPTFEKEGTKTAGPPPVEPDPLFALAFQPDPPATTPDPIQESSASTGAATVDAVTGPRSIAPTTPPKRNRLVWLVPLLVLGAGGMGGAVAIVAMKKEPSPPVQMQPQALSAAPPPPAVSSLPPVAASLEFPAAPAPAPAAPRPKAGVKRPPPAPAKVPNKNCADPYTRDELGRKIYKRECLTE